jgi:hypothetical protein
MWLIDRNSDGFSAARIPLPAELRSALVRWYTGDGSRRDEEAGILLVQQARIGEKWIACDCLGSSCKPPILTPAFLSEAETYYLRRLTGSLRPEHLPTCPFFRDQTTNRISEVRSPVTPADPPDGYFEVLRPAPEKLAQRPDSESNDDRTRAASVPRLARLLWRMLDVSGLAIAPPIFDEPAERSIAQEFRALSAAAGKLEIAPGIELGRALWTHADALHSRRAYAVIRNLARNWPRGHAPQGFLSVFAHRVSGSTIYPAGAEPIIVANRVQSPSGSANPVKGPFLVIVVIGEYPEAQGYAPLRAYAQPIFSGTRFVPVESEIERSVLRTLIDIRWALHRNDIDVAIEKPVFDRLTRLGACRPDFLLEARSRKTGEIRRLVVQAIGTQPDEGQSSKATALPRLAQIAPVVALSSEDLETGRARSVLVDALRD